MMATAVEAAEGTPWIWLAVGFLGQAVFFSRFLVQWIVSERRKQSVIPVAFWYLSLAGSALVLAYALYRLDPVFITGQACGFMIYTRNLMLLRRSAGAVEGNRPSDQSNPE